MSRKVPAKPYWEMTTKELREATQEFDEEFVADLWRLFHHATASPFGPMNEFLESTLNDIAHRLNVIGLQLRI